MARARLIVYNTIFFTTMYVQRTTFTTMFQPTSYCSSIPIKLTNFRKNDLSSSYCLPKGFARLPAPVLCLNVAQRSWKVFTVKYTQKHMKKNRGISWFISGIFLNDSVLSCVTSSPLGMYWNNNSLQIKKSQFALYIAQSMLKIPNL